MTCLLCFALTVLFFNRTITGCVGIILCICSVRDNKTLNILIKPCICPERISLITFNLVECFFYRNTTAFQFDMPERKSIDKNSDIITIVMDSTFVGGYSILIYDLQNIVMDICFISCLCIRVIDVLSLPLKTHAND